MITTPSQQSKRPPRRYAFLFGGAGPLVAACLLYTSAWGAGTVYVAQSGNDQNNGATPQTAVKSVARGLTLAAAGTEVQIAAGIYDEQLPPVPPGVTLSGGWDPSFDPAKRTLLTGESLRTLKAGSAKCGSQGAGLTCLTNSNGDRVVTLRSPGGQALRQLVVLGPDLSSKNDGSSSFGVIVDSASGVRLDYVSIEAGNGAAGLAGENKLPPVGTCTRGGVGGGGGYNTGQGTIWSSSCSAQPASAGDSVTNVNGVTVAAGGAGGATGHTECSNPEAVSGDLGNGARGRDGQGGVQGLAGAAAPTDPGQFTYAQPGGDLVWIGNHGGRGDDGSNGAGGGGGAAGDNGDIIYWCLASQPVRGGAGHNGGDGGCGGGGGGGGSSGGGAVALVAADTTVGSGGLVLFGGTGGSGGGGGSSAKGTSGVHDDSSGSTGESTGNVCGTGPARSAGTGGQGGYGGDGGGGGGGAGGNGGPSIQLVSLADGALTMDANATLRYAGGRAGTGGSGGTGVQDNNAGPPGNGGVSGHQMSIPLLYVSASASSSLPGAPPADAVDGNPNTAWNSGNSPPPSPWIELDLKQTVTLAKVHLLVEQSPAGTTTHQLYFGPSPAPTALIATLSQSTKDMQWLDVDVSDQKPTGRYLRVLTTVSPSWVAWREIVAQTQ